MSAEPAERGDAPHRPARRRSGRAASASSGQHKRITIFLWRVLVGLAIVGLWQLFSGRVLPVYEISSPAQVARELGKTLGSAAGWVDIGVTAKEIAIGFGVGVVAGALGGIILGTFRTVGMLLEPFISAINGIPKIALAPLFVLLLGIGVWTDAIIAAMMVSLIVFYNLYIGIRDISPDLINAVRLVGGGNWDVLRYVIAPSLVSPFFAGAKAAAPFAILGAIIGEFVASYQGVGYILSSASSNLNAAGIYSAIVILVLLGLILNSILSLLDALIARRLGMAP